MKSFAWVILVVLFIVGCGGSGGRGDYDTAVRLVGRERLEAQLKDPSSLEIISEEVIKPGRYGGKVGYRAKYRANNSFGGYVVDEFYTE